MFDNVYSSQATGQNKLEVEPYMVGDYIDGPRPAAVAKLLKSGAKLSRNDWTKVRDCLALQCLLNNAKRAGDIRHLPIEQVLTAEVPADKNRKVELSVSNILPS